MKSLLIMLLVVAAVQAQTTCKAGSLFQKSCNWCRCLSDGITVACTDKLCPEDIVNHPRSADQVCAPGTLFKKDCNVCKCSPDGKLSICTKMGCPEFKNFVDTDVKERFCEPEKVFALDDHNTCKCNRDGTSAMCTFSSSAVHMKELFTESSDQINQYCAPGTTFKLDECNTCKCSSDGAKAICSLSICPNKLSVLNKPKQICQPKSRFMNYCNNCVCSEDGTSFVCTKMWCDENIWNKNGTEKVRPSSQTFVQKQTDQNKVCQPLSQFKHYCNTCLCSSDGTSYACTKMHCDENIWLANGTRKVQEQHVCAPNSQFKEYCNTCVCSNNGLTKFCTMMDCDENIYNKDGSLKAQTLGSRLVSKKVCKPGHAFSPDECNTCVCNNEGSYYACTARACDSYEIRVVQDVVKRGPKYTPGSACAPGKLFYSECNQCVCLENGRDAFCTFKEC